MRDGRRSLGALLVAAVLGISTLTATGPVSAAPDPQVAGRGGDRGLARTLRAAMEATVQAGATSIITRVDRGREVTALAVGLSRLDPRRRARPTDAVRVGSITKSMVATVALQLAGQRRLRLSDTVARWLPGLLPGGEQITVRMLLNHTSGIFNYTDDPDFLPTLTADPYRTWTPRELVAIATAHEPLFAPGTSWSYSNTGYVVVGLILERATGVPLSRLLTQRIFEPLHLRHTFFATSGRFRGPHAHGYVPASLTGTDYVDISDWSPTWAWAAGAVVSNATDLDRFYSALLSGRLLRPWLLRQMLHAVEVEEGFGYGLGILRLDTPCGTVWGHDGSVPGYLSFAVFDRSGRRSAVVFLPTEADEAIVAATNEVVVTALCGMFGRPVPDETAARSSTGSMLRGLQDRPLGVIPARR